LQNIFRDITWKFWFIMWNVCLIKFSYTLLWKIIFAFTS
jgi:hypothetical protein